MVATELNGVDGCRILSLAVVTVPDGAAELSQFFYGCHPNLSLPPRLTVVVVDDGIATHSLRCIKSQ